MIIIIIITRVFIQDNLSLLFIRTDRLSCINISVIIIIIIII